MTRFSAARLAHGWRELSLRAPEHLFDALRERYAEPHRAYHTAQHIEECLVYVDLAHAPAPIELALWFHDAIYDPRRGDNEQRSAGWAARELEQVSAPEDLIARIRSLILVTKHDAIPSGSDEQLLTDIDLSILGAPRERFLEYESQVRFEYSFVPEDAFRGARAAILRQFLARPAIYSTPFFRERLEEQARANLTASVDRHAPC